MRAVLTSLVAVVVVLGVSCTRSDGPVARADGASAPSTGVPAGQDGVVEALADAGVDTAQLPARLGELAGREFCGSDERGHGGGELSDAARCFLDRHIAEVDAVYVTSLLTLEGDPVVLVHISGRDGAVASFADSTRDAFGSGRWDRLDARRVAFSSSDDPRIELVDAVDTELDAALPDPVDEEPPDWFVGRRRLPWCGMDVRVEDEAFGARRCFRDAVGRGEQAEYAVGQTGDEGERGIKWFRVLGPGVIEVIERSLPGAPPTADAPPTWSRHRCSDVSFVTEPGWEVDLLPQIDGPASCGEP